MKPIIISTHRTGSSLLCRRLFNIAKHNWGYLSNLYKFLNIGPNFQQIMEEIEDITYITKTINYDPPFKWWDDRNLEIEKRLNILQSKPVYMVKVHAIHITQEIFKFIKSGGYTVFYTHRRNKLDQYLSFLAATHNSKWKFSSTDQSINQIKYDRNLTQSFIRQFEVMNKIRNNLDGIDIWYEDFMANGGHEGAIINIAGISASVPTSCEIDTVPTPYQSDKESLIINKEEWLNDRKHILEKLNSL